MSGETPKTEELPKTTTNVVNALGIGVDEAKTIGQKMIEDVIAHPIETKPEICGFLLKAKDTGPNPKIPNVDILCQNHKPCPIDHKKDVGRPTVLTPQTIGKLEEVFALGGTDLEACFYAGIGKTALYEYQKENPEFTERKEALKQKPILKARQTIIQALDNPQHAQWFMERKNKKEFSVRVESTGADGKDLNPLSTEQKDKLDSLLFKKEV